MPSPFYSASVVLFQLHGGMVSHMQALATPSITVHSTWILTTEVLAACSSIIKPTRPYFSPHRKAKAKRPNRRKIGI